MEIQYDHPKSERTVGLWFEAISAFVPVCVVPWVGFQKQEHAERPQSLCVFSVSHPFSASTDFLCFFCDAQPMTYPTVPSFTVKPNDPHREHMLPFNGEKLL